MSKSLGQDEEVVRYVGGVHIDPENGDIDGSAFHRPPKDKDGLSFTRRYLLSISEQEDIAAIREIFASRMKLGKTAQFAQLQVGAALEVLNQFDEFFDFVEDPLSQENECLSNPAHALLLGLPFKGEAIGSLRSDLAGDLIASCINRAFPAHAPSA